jgi:hypothetical protein
MSALRFAAACLLTPLLSLCAACSRSPEQPEHLVRAGPVLRGAYVTDSGMHGLWSRTAYADVDYGNWAEHFIDQASLGAHIAKGDFVPVYVHSDGVPVIELRSGRAGAPAALSGEERGRVRARSDPYLFVSDGAVNVSGIEYVNGDPDPYVGAMRLPEGRWTAVVYFLEWPESRSGEAGSHPPDFVVTLNPEVGSPRYRRSVETFSREAWDRIPNQGGAAQ